MPERRHGVRRELGEDGKAWDLRLRCLERERRPGVGAAALPLPLSRC